MKPSAIPLFRVLPAELSNGNSLGAAFEFFSSQHDPGARAVSPLEYALGNDSDWTADHHDLTVVCRLGQPDALAVLFGTGGITPQGSRLQLALEWTSAESGWRQLGVPVDLRHQQCAAGTAPLSLSLTLAPGALRGSGKVALQVFLADAAVTGAVGGIATEPGFRFGALCAPVTLVIDGDSSLFPILEESSEADGPLWQFRECWIDPETDPFSAEYVSLVLNTDHPHFGLLHDRRDGAAQTPLMRQILAAWIALFVGEVMRALEGRFSELVGEAGDAAEGTIAAIAVDFVRSGELDTASPAALAASAQCWLDRKLTEPEVSE